MACLRASKYRTRAGRGFFLLAIGLTATQLLAQGSSPPPASSDALGSALVRPLLAGDWDDVLRILDAKKVSNLTPVERLVRGHACLAVNRDDDALESFWIPSMSRESAQEWLKLTSGWAAAYPGNSTCAYLCGDAWARTRNFDKAIAEFGRGLALDPQSALNYNARGVCYAYRQDWSRAQDDFDSAKRCRPDLADVYANDGDVYVSRSKNPIGALKDFTAAIAKARDHKFRLAIIGQASAQYGAGRFSEAKDLVDPLVKDPYCARIAIPNLLAIRLAIDTTQLVAIADRNAGTSINVAPVGSPSRAAQDKLTTTALNVANAEVARAGQNLSAVRPAQDSALQAIKGGAGTILDAALPQVKRFDLTATVSPKGASVSAGFDFRDNPNPGRRLVDGVAELVRGCADLTRQAVTAVGDMFRRPAPPTMTSTHNLPDPTQIIHCLNGSMPTPSGSIKGGVDTAAIGQVLKDRGEWFLAAMPTLQYPVPDAAPKGN